MLYDGSVIAKETNVISIADSEETLMLEEENFGKRVVPQQELSDKNAFWLQTSHPNTDQSASSRVKIEVPQELPKPTKPKQHFNGLCNQSGGVSDTCPDIYKPSKKLVAVRPINKKKTVRFTEPIISSSTSQKQLGSSQIKTKQTTNNYVSTSIKVSRSTKSSKSKSTDNTKNDSILQISSNTQKKNKVEDHSRIVKSCLNKPNYVVEASTNANVHHSKLNTTSELMCVKCNSSMFDARYELWILEFVSDTNASSKSKSVKKAKKKEEWKPTGKVCSKHMTRDRSQLPNFVHKFLGTVKFDNDQITKIMRKKYILVIVDDYSQFTWIKFLASHDEALDFIIKFLKMIQVRLNAPVRNIHTNNGTEFVNETLRSYYKSVGIYHETSVARCPQQNGVVERQNCTLIEAARTMLIYAKALLFLWAKVVATACYTQNRSIIRRRHGKTLYELLHDIKPDLAYLHVFGALCYPNNDSEDLGKFQAKADIGIFIKYVPKKKAYLLVAAAPRAVDLADSPVSTSIDQDASSISIPSTQDQDHSLIISQGFKESPKTPHFHDDPLYESLHEDSTSHGSSCNMKPIHTPFESLGGWTKDHPITNVIGDQKV
nr:integrase, catalytic region, zinc finger, CCHC-type, peptidase aspartic, catalytic [Tanacetum cinerariifolium]